MTGIESIPIAMVESISKSISSLAACAFLSIGSNGTRTRLRNDSSRSAIGALDWMRRGLKAASV